MNLPALLDALGYLRSERHWVTPDTADARLAHLYRLARKAGDVGQGAEVVGSYVYQTSKGNELTPPRPAVFVAQAANEEQAREIHKRLWNMGDCPFVVVVLPGAVRVYTGFDYRVSDPKRTIIANAFSTLSEDLPDSLRPFHADAIDSGRIWAQQSKYLGSETRVDYRLLTNLKELSRQLQGDYSLAPEVAHALIGKYIYFRYLRDRKILDDAWLNDRGLRPEEVFGRGATAQAFETLAEALQIQFNGDVLPFPAADTDEWHTNGAVPFLASIFYGNSPNGQLAFDFGVYDFSYIPVELLSSIYEQFLKSEGRGEGDGVVYTPEALAYFVLAELEAVHPLKLTHQILDPCCGSGVFLVLAYRRLIERLWREQGERPSAEAMKSLLENNIYGVEKDPEACHITVFSLLLTLLSHLEPPELHANAGFQFPTLVGANIYQADFFDDDCPVFKEAMSFDWVVGNPPWVGADYRNQDHQFALNWIHKAAKDGREVGARRLDEAFSWRAGNLLREEGCAGLLVKATTLVNSSSAAYRKGFFEAYDVRRISNLANLCYLLFIGQEGQRSKAPTACLIYKNSVPGIAKKPILHFGPFVADQAPMRAKGSRRRAWTIMLYESDIQEINYQDAVDDVPCLWKMALWGGHQDRRTLRRLHRLLPSTLEAVADEEGWLLCGGPHIKGLNGKSRGNFVPAAELKDQRILETKSLTTRFALTEGALPLLEPERQFIEKRKGTKGLQLIPAPHVLITAEAAIYSDADFAIPAPKVGIAGSHQGADYLKAIAFYLNSSISRYAHFFHSSLWGIYIGTINPENVGAIPFAKLSEQQIQELATAYDDLADRERTHFARYLPLRATPLDLQDEVDAVVEATLEVPESISFVAREFMRVRYQLNQGKLGDTASGPPTPAGMKGYAEQLRGQVDDFAQRRHRISVRAGSEATIATVEATSEPETLPVSVSSEWSPVARDILRAVEEQHSQWAYVQRSVRIFDGPRVHIIKSSRLLDWTRTQAIQDAADLISEVLDKTAPRHEPAA